MAGSKSKCHTSPRDGSEGFISCRVRPQEFAPTGRAPEVPPSTLSDLSAELQNRHSLHARTSRGDIARSPFPGPLAWTYPLLRRVDGAAQERGVWCGRRNFGLRQRIFTAVAGGPLGAGQHDEGRHKTPQENGDGMAEDEILVFEFRLQQRSDGQVHVL